MVFKQSKKSRDIFYGQMLAFLSADEHLPHICIGIYIASHEISGSNRLDKHQDSILHAILNGTNSFSLLLISISLLNAGFKLSGISSQNK